MGKDAIHHALVKVEDEKAEKATNPALEGIAHDMAAKLMENLVIKKTVNDIKVEEDPKVKAEKTQKLKDAIHHALLKVEDEKAEKEINPALKDMAHKMASKLMENPIIKQSVNDINVEEDPIKKAEKVEKMHDAIHHALEVVISKKKDATKSQEEPKIKQDSEKVNVEEKKDVSPAVKDMAHKITMKLMKNPEFKDQVNKMNKEQDPKIKAELFGRMKDAIHHALELAKTKKKDEKVQQEQKPKLDSKEVEQSSNGLDSKLKDVAHNVAEKLLDNADVKKRVHDIIVTKDPEEKAEKVNKLKDAIHQAVHGAIEI